MTNGITKSNVKVRPVGLTEDQKRAVRRVARQSAGKTDWTEEEARAEGLHPYYARDWFLWELSRLKSLAAMEAEHGDSNHVLSNWGMRHDLALKPGLRPKLTLQLATATTIRGSGALASALCELLENGSRTAPDSAHEALEGVQP